MALLLCITLTLVIQSFQGLTVTAQSCGGSHQGEQGSISSPNYPSDYPNGIPCTWNIEVPSGNAIEITFPADSFLEYYSSCYRDSLIFDDVYRNPPHQYRRLCGYIASGTKIVTSSRRLTVVLTTSSSNSGYGFLFEWKAFQTRCDEVFTGESGTITSPNYPSLYPEMMYCKWTIRVAVGKIIEVLFPDEFTIEYYTSCRNYYLELHDRTVNPPVTYRTMCGAYPAGTRIATSSKNLDVIFKTNSLVVYPGWTIHWRAVGTLCGETFTGTSGTLSSPFYPLEYPSRLNCRWYIEVPADRTIEVVFPAEISIEYYSSCLRDKLLFIDGLSYPATTYATLCGKIEAGYTISTTTSKLEIVFTTNSAVAFDGWSFNWRASGVTCYGDSDPDTTNTCEKKTCASVTESECNSCPLIADACCLKCLSYATRNPGLSSSVRSMSTATTTTTTTALTQTSIPATTITTPARPPPVTAGASSTSPSTPTSLRTTSTSDWISSTLQATSLKTGAASTTSEAASSISEVITSSSESPSTISEVTSSSSRICCACNFVLFTIPSLLYIAQL